MQLNSQLDKVTIIWTQEHKHLCPNFAHEVGKNCHIEKSTHNFLHLRWGWSQKLYIKNTLHFVDQKSLRILETNRKKAKIAHKKNTLHFADKKIGMKVESQVSSSWAEGTCQSRPPKWSQIRIYIFNILPFYISYPSFYLFRIRYINICSTYPTESIGFPFLS